jgi:hypothetical protein
LWRNRLEFYPAISLFFWYTVGSWLSSLRVQNRPGIVELGLITVPVVIIFFIAVARAYRELPQEGGQGRSESGKAAR